jgi:hypothetical protein
VYLLVRLKQIEPSANMPIVELPAAEPSYDAEVEAVADELVSHEYVYLFLVDDAPLTLPKAKIPTHELPVADCKLDPAVAEVALEFVSEE